ncbi:hypothetical protein I79_000663 [Cricetulus griseus]|uniref:Uncharacterized protein n=1 Tax=Cricetulus griseus TaxID=10029 RepID=G3GSP6_CRIGR|nr:hypothetical protein I79_000663 [Cricetulus griseus]
MVYLKLRTECDFQVGQQQHQAFIRNGKQTQEKGSSVTDPSSASWVWCQSHCPLAQFAFRGAFPSRTVLYSMTNSTGPLIMEQTPATSGPNLSTMQINTTHLQSTAVHLKEPIPSRGRLGRSEAVKQEDVSKSDKVPTPQRSTFFVHTSLLDVTLGETGYSQFIKEHHYLKGEINSC